MSKDTELMSAIDTAKQAEAIINHPLHIATIESLKELTHDKFKSLSNSDLVSMQECNLRLKLIDELEDNYSLLIFNGEVAFKSLEEIAEFKKATNQ